MRFYAAEPRRRTVQIAVDVLVVVWLWCAYWVAVQVDDGLSAVSDQVRQVETAGSRLEEGLASAGDTLDGTPVVGDDIAEPFDRAARSSGEIAQAGADAASAVDSLAGWLGIAAFVVLVLIALPWYLPNRIRFIVTATMLRRYADDGADLDLLALRALSRQPVPRLVRHSRDYPDAARGWREGDPEAIRALANLELRSAGVPEL